MQTQGIANMQTKMAIANEKGRRTEIEEEAKAVNDQIKYIKKKPVHIELVSDLRATHALAAREVAQSRGAAHSRQAPDGGGQEPHPAFPPARHALFCEGQCHILRLG